MKVNLFNCARKKLVGKYPALSSSDLSRRSIMLKPLMLVMSMVLGIGVGEVEASTTYTGILAADSPSYIISGNPRYYASYTFTVPSSTAYQFGLSTTSMSEDVDPLVNLYSFFDPSTPNTGKTIIAPGHSATLSEGTYTALVLLGTNQLGDYTFTTTPAITAVPQFTVNTASKTFNTSTLPTAGNIVSSYAGGSTVKFNYSGGNFFYNYGLNATITDFEEASGNTLTLAGSNQYTGKTTVSTGSTLSLAKNSIPSASTIHLNTGLLAPAASFTLPNPIVLDANGTINAQGQAFVLGGNISGSYGLTITSTVAGAVSSSGSVSLTGSNSYTGATTVSGGTLKLSAAPNGEKITFSGGSLQAGGSFSMSNAIEVNSTGLNTDTYDVTFTGQLSGTNFTKSGTGTLTLSGTSNLETGTITVSAGTLAVQSATSLGNSEIDISLNGGTLKATGAFSPTTNGNCISVNTDSSIDTNGYTFTLLGSLTVASGKIAEFKDRGSGGVFDVTSASSVTSAYTTTPPPPAGTIKLTGGTYRINAASQLGGSTTILNGGTLKLAANGITLPALSMTDSSTINTDTYTVTMINAIMGSSTSTKSFTKSGTGTMILSAANTFIGPVIVSAGELDVSDVTAQLSGATYVKLGNGAHLKFTAGGALSCPLVL